MQWRRRTALGMAALLALIVLGVLYLSWSGQRPSCPAAPATQPAVSHAVLPAAHDDSFQRPALRSETVPAEPHQPSAPPGSHATLPAAPVVLLAFNEDLNADDDRTPQAGGEAESRFRRAFEQSNPRVPIRTPLAAPAVWNSALAVETARQLGASVALVGELEARPIGRIANVGPSADNRLSMGTALRTALVRVAMSTWKRLPDVAPFRRGRGGAVRRDGFPTWWRRCFDVCARSRVVLSAWLQERVSGASRARCHALCRCSHGVYRRLFIKGPREVALTVIAQLPRLLPQRVKPRTTCESSPASALHRPLEQDGNAFWYCARTGNPLDRGEFGPTASPSP
jgi:hypothetical protein